MAFSSHHKEDVSGNVQLGQLREELVEDPEVQNSTKFILEENSQADLEESTDEGAKIHRTRFTAFQKFGLEEAFASCQYVRSHDCQVLAERLGLSVKTVQVWFRNKRFKIRKLARQERQRHRHQPSASNSSFGNIKNQELPMVQASSSTYMPVDRRIPYALYLPSPFLGTDDYLMPACYSPSFTSPQSFGFLPYHRSHPYQ